MHCSAIPIPEDSRELHEPTTSGHPFRFGKLATGTQFEMGARAYFELPLTVVVISSCLHGDAGGNRIRRQPAIH
jgi:hypothetical protein